MDQQIRTTMRMSDDIAVIDIEGDMTSSSYEVIEQAYGEVSGKGHKKILLSFREGDYINSAGIASIIELVLESKKGEGVVRIAHPSAHSRRLFTLVGLSQHVQVFPSDTEALKDF